MRKQAHSGDDLTLDEIADMLSDALGGLSQASWARANKTFPSDVSKVLHLKEWPSKAICEALGIERVPHIYRRKK